MKIAKLKGNPRILISGGWGYGNRGDNAILDGTLKSLRQQLPDAEFSCLSYSPEELSENHGLESAPSLHRLIERAHVPGLLLDAWMKATEVSRKRVPYPPLIARHLKTISSFDLVVMAGGGYFNDSWKDMLYSQYLFIRLCALAGTPVVIAGQTIGPFHEGQVKSDLARHLALIDRVAVRDQQSYDIAVEAGVKPERLHLTADNANLLRPDKIEWPDRDRLVVGLMTQFYRGHEGKNGPSPAGRLSRGTYLASLVEAIRTVAEQREVRFRIIPSTTWDERFQNRLIATLKDHPVDFDIVRNPDVETYVAACQSVDVMVSTNMHPVILASTVDRPSLALSYNFKLDDFMADIGLVDYLERIDDFVPATVAAKIVDLIDRRREISREMEPRTQRLRERAIVNARLIADYFR